MAMPEGTVQRQVKTKFTPVEAARVAFTQRPPARPRLRTRNRLLRASAVIWCRELQFPTVRELGRELGLSSTSSVVVGFRGLIDVQAAVIGQEWQELETCWVAPADQRLANLVGHAEELAALGQPCLRLPALVWSSVTTADPARAATMPGMGLAVHVLAAFADPGCGRPNATHIGRAMSATQPASNCDEMAVVA